MKPAGLLVEPEELRRKVREEYREVAREPERRFHFHTGRALAARLGYDDSSVDALPERGCHRRGGPSRRRGRRRGSGL